MAGVIRTKEAVTGFGIRPSVTIASENTIRISLAWARLSSDPLGPVLTIVSGGCWAATGAARSNAVQRAATKGDVRITAFYSEEEKGVID
jgi:hypothetical protein